LAEQCARKQFGLANHINLRVINLGISKFFGIIRKIKDSLQAKPQALCKGNPKRSHYRVHSTKGFRCSCTYVAISREETLNETLEHAIHQMVKVPLKSDGYSSAANISLPQVSQLLC
jgi:hypothetical protein